MVPADSHRIPRVPRYSGYRYGRCRLRVQVSHLLRNDFPDISAHLHLSDIAVLQPRHCVATAPVWALPRSLATTGGITFCFLFLLVLRCFSSQRSLPLWWVTVHQTAGLPHSDTHGSRVACTSPWIFAACRVLLRLPEPRHPPCALSCFRRSLHCWRKHIPWKY